MRRHTEKESQKDSPKRHEGKSGKKKGRLDGESSGTSAAKIALGAFFLILVLGGFLQAVTTIYSTAFGGFKYVKASNTAFLKDILLGGDPWLVYCAYPNTPAEKLHPLLEKSISDLQPFVSLAQLDCSAKMESGRSVLERFKLLNSTIGFVVANKTPPQPIPQYSMQSTEKLLKFVETTIKPKVKFIDRPGAFDKLCTGRSPCMVVGHREMLDSKWIDTTLYDSMTLHRQVTVALVNTRKFKMQLEDSLISTLPKDKQLTRLLCLTRLPPTSKIEDGEWIGTFFNGDKTSFSSLKSFMKACGSKHKSVPSGFVRLEKTPILLNRKSTTKKTNETKQKETEQKSTGEDAKEAEAEASPQVEYESVEDETRYSDDEAEEIEL